MRDNSKIDMKELGTRIREARTKCGLSQMDLADACSISVPYVSEIERGKKCFSVDILLRIAQALQVSTDWLLRIDFPKTKYTYSEEAFSVFEDCTPDEAKVLLDLLKSNKDVICKKTTN